MVYDREPETRTVVTKGRQMAAHIVEHFCRAFAVGNRSSAGRSH
jgi:hypothetical protein